MPVLQLPDTDLHYETFGQGPAFLFNPATAWHGEAWKLHQVPEFSRDHMVITYDPRGTGKSVTRGKDFSTRRLAADAAALLDHLGIKSTIALGHSNGGRIAQTLATEYPDRVNKLILASSGATHTGPAGVPIKMCIELVNKGYERYTLEHMLEVGFTKAYYEANREICDRFIKVRMSNLLPIENFLGYVVARQESDTTARLKDIKAPTLVMVGDDEDHGSSGPTHLDFARLLADKIAGAKFVMLKGQGHHYLFVAPDMANKAIREFLAAS
ncbi:MAG TPA: alpha/beta hydrolase [Alphaproteobacteria bacterium]|jgi:pimeloyl-ACP methyl ester carboxylesterase|nr:alpha/beta hydrolase [Alphaproteobacteria bacterium]